MPRPRSDDVFAPVKRQAARVPTTLSREIQKRESELRQLISDANSWRAALDVGGRALHVDDGADLASWQGTVREGRRCQPASNHSTRCQAEEPQGSG